MYIININNTAGGFCNVAGSTKVSHPSLTLFAECRVASHSAAGVSAAPDKEFSSSTGLFPLLLLTHTHTDTYAPPLKAVCREKRRLAQQIALRSFNKGQLAPLA